MMPASMVTVLRSVLPAAFPVSARVGNDRRNAARFFRPVAACGDDDDQLPSMAAVPASLRAIQAKRKLAEARRRRAPRAAATSAAEGAVAALVKAVGAVQCAAVGGAAEAARGAGDAVAWVLNKVHLQSSPDLLGTIASCLGRAVDNNIEAERARGSTAQAKKPDQSSGNEEPEPEDNDDDDDGHTEDADDLPQLVETDQERELWAGIGIMHGERYKFEELDEDEIQEINSARARRRRAVYERIIVSGGANSLILSNYAELLYEFDKDMKRAEMYFKRAVGTEPADGEARRRYAMFLWFVRGDMAGAEDMFTKAIDEEPENCHIRASYACFLWMTGGGDTCLTDTAGAVNNGGVDAE